MASEPSNADPVGGELARVMRAVTWFLLFPLVLRIASILSAPLPARLDRLEIAVWLVGAGAFYMGFRGRPRDPNTWSAAVTFTVFAIETSLRTGFTADAVVLVPFALSVLAVLLLPATTAPIADDEERIDPGHPLATVALLEKHAAELEAAGKLAESAKLRERIHKIRAKAGNG